MQFTRVLLVRCSMARSPLPLALGGWSISTGIDREETPTRRTGFRRPRKRDPPSTCRAPTSSRQPIGVSDGPVADGLGKICWPVTFVFGQFTTGWNQLVVLVGFHVCKVRHFSACWNPQILGVGDRLGDCRRARFNIANLVATLPAGRPGESFDKMMQTMYARMGFIQRFR